MNKRLKRILKDSLGLVAIDMPIHAAKMGARAMGEVNDLIARGGAAVLRKAARAGLNKTAARLGRAGNFLRKMDHRLANAVLIKGRRVARGLEKQLGIDPV